MERVRVTPSLLQRGRQPKGASPLDPPLRIFFYRVPDQGFSPGMAGKFPIRKPRPETRRGAPIGAAGGYHYRGYGGLNPHNCSLKDLIFLRDLVIDVQWDLCG